MLLDLLRIQYSIKNFYLVQRSVHCVRIVARSEHQASGGISDPRFGIRGFVLKNSVYVGFYLSARTVHHRRYEVVFSNHYSSFWRISNRLARRSSIEGRGNHMDASTSVYPESVLPTAARGGAGIGNRPFEKHVLPIRTERIDTENGFERSDAPRSADIYGRAVGNFDLVHRRPSGETPGLSGKPVHENRSGHRSYVSVPTQVRKLSIVSGPAGTGDAGSFHVPIACESRVERLHDEGFLRHASRVRRKKVHATIRNETRVRRKQACGVRRSGRDYQGRQ